MSVNLNNSTDCCNTDCTNTTVNVPGPQGDAGAAGTNGTNGTNGYNGYSITDSDFTIPSANTNANIPVDHTGWIAATPTADTQIIFIGNAGHFLVSGKGTGHITGKPLFYTTDPGTVGQVIPAGTVVSPAGLQGPAGATGDASTLLTAKGDLITRTSTGATTIGVGAATDGKTLFANSTLNTGLEWKAINFTDVSGTITSATQISDKSLPLAKLTGPSDAEGDLAYYNGTSWARLPHGSDGQVLTVSGGVPTWVAASSSGLSVVAEGDITFAYQSGTPQIDSVSITNAVNLSAPTCFAGDAATSVTITFDTAIGSARPVVIFTDTSSGVNTSGWKVTATSATAITINTGITSNVSNMSFRVQVLA